MMRKLTLILFVLFVGSTSSMLAQDTVDMAEIMRSNGKIYVVVAVAAIVMIGILIYLIFLDRKISSIEKKIKHKA